MNYIKYCTDAIFMRKNKFKGKNNGITKGIIISSKTKKRHNI